MNRRFVLAAGAAVLASGPASAQTGQQRAQPAQGQTGGQADWGDRSAVASRSGVPSWAAQAPDPARSSVNVAAPASLL